MVRTKEVTNKSPRLKLSHEYWHVQIWVGIIWMLKPHSKIDHLNQLYLE